MKTKLIKDRIPLPKQKPQQFKSVKDYDRNPKHKKDKMKFDDFYEEADLAELVEDLLTEINEPLPTLSKIKSERFGDVSIWIRSHGTERTKEREVDNTRLAEIIKLALPKREEDIVRNKQLAGVQFWVNDYDGNMAVLARYNIPEINNKQTLEQKKKLGVVPETNITVPEFVCITVLGANEPRLIDNNNFKNYVIEDGVIRDKSKQDSDPKFLKKQNALKSLLKKR